MDTARENHSVLSFLEDLFRGAALSLFSWIPFSSYRNLNETLPERKTKAFPSFEQDLKHHLFNDIGLWIGLLLGAIFFFSIHVSYLLENFKTSVYGALLAFLVPTLVAEIFQYIRHLTHVKKWHIFLSLALFAASFSLSVVAFLFFQVSPKPFLSFPTYAYVFVLMTIGSFLASYTGIGWGSVFFLFRFYLTFAEGVYPLSLLHHISSFLPLILFGLFGALIGSLLSLFLKKREEIEKSDFFLERGSLNIGILLSGAFLIPFYLLKAPYFTGYADSIIAEKITLYTAVIGGFFISLALTIHIYPFGRRNHHAS